MARKVISLWVCLILCSGMLISRAATAPSSRTAKADFSGVVTDAKTGEPLIGVALKLDGGVLWALTDEKGRYSFTDLSDGRYLLETDYLGYVSDSRELVIKAGAVLDAAGKSLAAVNFSLQLQSLALEEVTVTAERSKSGVNTSVSIGRDALNHMQVSDIADISSLLPGGKTLNPDLTQEKPISLRDGGVCAGYAAFGAAVEVDGVRLGGNASLGEMSGVSTRSIAVENIESVEVITGVPSAEYGDLNSGMVKVTTKKGRTPVNLTLTVNPRTWQASVSKGVELGPKAGVLNLSGEWARATTSLISPYSAYTRREASVSYSNTFMKNLRFEAGITGNIGGMNTKDDPDANHGNITEGRDNVIRANTSLDWLLRKSWITSLRLEATVFYNDKRTHEHKSENWASSKPAAHSEVEGYYLTNQLPLSYFYDKIVDSRELDWSASLKYRWIKRWGDWRNELKAGIQWKANGNAGEGEYYETGPNGVNLSPDGYRPRPYHQYPYMHNISYWVEDRLTAPIGSTKLELMAGLRLETVYVKGSKYTDIASLSPRFNAKWHLGKGWAVRGGWGIAEKLPSFYVLYPRQEYWDKKVFSMAYGTGGDEYNVYYTRPYALEYNPQLKWQRSSNSELAVEWEGAGFKFSLVGFYNVTRNPYVYDERYLPFSYKTLVKPDAFVPGNNPSIRVDSASGDIFLSNDNWASQVQADVKLTDKTFVQERQPSNGADIHRAGAELIVDFPEIKPIRTVFRLDASYNHSWYLDESIRYYYPSVSSSEGSYGYVGIYPLGDGSSISNGKKTHNLDANLTAIVRIPEARLVVTARFEASLLKLFRNLSQYQGQEYAYAYETKKEQRLSGVSIYEGGHKTAVWPIAYLDNEGVEHPFTAASAADSKLKALIQTSNNDYTFAQDGYGFYWSANLSVTKEIGDHVSLSFFANNFTNNRQTVYSKATGVGAIFTPVFYYGLTCRLKF